MFKKLPLFNNI